MKLNKLMLAGFIASMSLATALPAVADDAHHPDQAAASQSVPPNAKASAQTIKGMQANVKKMQTQLERIAKAKTDDERQKAMTEHMLTMQENMQMARGMQAGIMGCPMMGMMGPGMMGPGMMGPGMAGQGMMGPGMAGSGMAGSGSPMGGVYDRMQQMEKRMDMMEMMMKSGGQGMPGMGKP
ncbi:MAG: hypothetical protein CVU33_13190 [Betaproteobacteria bacterium HGW-Betaproteobacteria-6]|jgi:hypothetical protein|nr:MAG: hypothetical protein CVU33_13190 [Betaproteobacteria bacterium HGW-Betaproteobacteria-6]